jgi:hypothetical protein
MNPTQSETVSILIELLENTDTKQMPLKELESRLQKRLKFRTGIDVNPIDIIETSLDNWTVDKILDYDDSSEESIGKPVWFIRLLDEEETEILRNLSDEAKCLLKILRKSKTEENLGVVRTKDVLKTLREKGYDLDLVPYIPERVDDYFKTIDGELIQFHYLVPEDEKSEEYKAGLKELDEIARKKLDRRER